MNWDVGIEDFFWLHLPPPCVWENTNQEETDRDWEQVTNDLMEEDALAQNTVSLLFIYKDSELATVDCYKLQVSSVMMIMIMRSKYFLWNLFLFKDSGGGLLSFVRLRVNKKTEF